MGRFADRFLDISIERGARDLRGLVPRRLGGTAIERAVADEGELADAGAGALINHAADRLGEGRVPHAVEHYLRDRAAALQRLVAGFVIDGLGEAQQRTALVRVVAADDEAARGMKRPDWRTAARR